MCPSEQSTPALDGRAQCLRDAAEALYFLTPGLTHALGNSLFVIKGHLQLWAGSGNQESAGALNQSTDRIGVALDVLRLVHGESSQATIPSPRLLEGVCDLARVGLRQCGLGVALECAGKRIPRAEGRALCRSVALSLARLGECLPSGYRGQVTVRLDQATSGRLAVDLVVDSEPGQLPFPIDWAAVAEGLAPTFFRLSVEADTDSRRMQLLFRTS